MTTFVNNDVASGNVIYAADHNTQGALLAGVLNGNVDSSNLADGAATTAKIADSNVTTGKLADASVTPAKLATGATTAAVATAEDTSSASYVALTTAGPASTVTIGANGIALVSVRAIVGNSTANAQNYMGFAISGATTVASADAFAAVRRINDASIAGQDGLADTFLVTGLTPGSTTFTSQYKVNAGSGRFSTRKITVIPL